MSPSSPRQVTIDPHLPASNRSHAITLSPNALSPSRAIGPHHSQHIRGNSNHGRSYREDPETARERQVQQDLESAMSMCKCLITPLCVERFMLHEASGNERRGSRVAADRPSPSTFWLYRQPRHLTRYASVTDALPFDIAHRGDVVFHAFRLGGTGDGPCKIVAL